MNRLVYFAGTPGPGEIDRLKGDGYGIVTPETEPTTREQIGDLLAWICAKAYGVYLCAGWRSSKLFRAVRATAIAAGLVMFGFE